MGRLLEDIGEQGLIHLIRQKFSSSQKAIVGIGDDAAVYSCQNKFVVLTTDAFIEGVHFSLSYFTPHDVGYRALAATLSDIAAMAASPLGFLVSLGLPKKFEVDFVEEIYEGFKKLTSEYEVELWGGDIVFSPVFFLSLTAFGEVEETRLCLRSAAKIGQLIVVTGDLGLSEAGRLILQERLSNEGYSELIEKHLHPKPRIREAQAIGGAITGAMEDTSDGLLTELKHITEESNVGAIIDINKVLVKKSVKQIANKLSFDPLDLVLSGGEDFELVFTAYPEEIEKARSEIEKFKLKLTVIGEVIGEKGVFLKKGTEVKKTKNFGYEHFKKK
jgi:thiamine-monophosphate kinase